MLRKLVALGIGVILVACSAASPDRENSATVQSADTAPASGTLAFSDAWSFHTRVGLDQPDANGWVNVNYPKSAAMLIGSGLGTTTTVAKLDLTFQPTNLDAQFDNANYGSARRVCGTLDRHEYCWNAAGTCEARLDGVVFYSATCAPLALGQTYRIQVSATRSAQEQNTFLFMFNGTAQAGQFLTEPWVGGGQAAFHIERANARLKLSGQRSGTAPSTLSTLTTAGPAGTLLPLSGTLPPVSNLVNNGSTASFVLPSGAVRLNVYRDGYLYDSTSVTAGTYSVAISNALERTLDDTHYSYQLVWANAAGNLSQPALTSFTLPPRPSPPRIADGAMKIALVLAYYQDAPGLVNGLPPTAPQELSDAFFTRPNSPGVAFREISRNTVTVSGKTFGWMKLRQSPQPATSPVALIRPPNQPNCGTPVSGGFTYHCFYSYNGPAQAAVDYSDANVGAAAALHPSDYDLVYTLVYGDTTQDSSISPANRPIDTGLMLHEVFGHNNTLAHAGGFFHSCSTGVYSNGSELANVIPGSFFGGTLPGALCSDAPTGSVTGVSTYADIYDPMGSAAGHYYHTMNLEKLGFLHPVEVARDYFGGAYTLSRWQRDQTSTKQLRIQFEDNWFYFLEYRTGEGFDGAAACTDPSCNPIVQKNAASLPGVQIRLFRSTGDAADPYPSTPGETMLLTEQPLQNGGSWCDPYRGVRVTRTGSTPDFASVQVMRGPCTPAAQCGPFLDADTTQESISLLQNWPSATQTYTPTRTGYLKQLKLFLTSNGTYQLNFHELGCASGICAPFYSQPVTLNGDTIVLAGTGVPVVAGHTIAFSVTGTPTLTVIGVTGDTYTGGALLDPSNQPTDSDLPLLAYVSPSGCQ